MSMYGFFRDVAVKVAVKAGVYPKVVTFLNRWIAKREAVAIKKHGVEVLAKVDEVLVKEKVTPFLFGGLLLGAYRDKGFIPYDYDLDLGVMGAERPKNMINIMRENGFRLIRQFYVKETGWISIEQYECKNVPVDFYYFYEEAENRIAVLIPGKHEYKDWKEANETDGFPSQILTAEKSTFSRQDFLGIQLYMPDKAASWLEDFYGADFMTPMKNWEAGERKTTRRPSPVRQYRNLEIVERQKNS